MKNVARAPARAERALPGAVGRRVARARRATRCLCAGPALLLGCSLGWASAAAAQDTSSAGPQPSTSANSLPDALRKLTDPNGVRSKLEQAGIKFTFTYYGDAFANPIGGVRQDAGYDGRFGTIIDADLDKLAGWAGATFHASFH